MPRSPAIDPELAPEENPLIKKLGLVTVGVTATLMAAAPLASATTSHHDSDDGGSSGCAFVAGNGGDAGSGDASGLLGGATGLNAGGIGGSNIGNIGDCSSFLNGNLNGNHVLSDNTVAAPTLPKLPV
jgi:hypothetical protein